MPLLYNLLLFFGSPLIAVYLSYRLCFQGKSRMGLLQRLGWAPRLPEPPAAGRVWLHAVSAGEAVAAAAVARRLRDLQPETEIVVSTTTPAGHQQARRLLPDAAACFYFPFDFLPCVLLALARIRPTAVASVETEIWPNWLWLARRSGIRTALVNGIFADRGFARARRARWFYRWSLAQLDVLAMQSRQAVERALYLGAPEERVRLSGNAKLEQGVPVTRPEAAAVVRSSLDLERGRPLWIAGSTHPGEEEQVLEAYALARERLPDLALLLVPRHVERAADVERLVRERGFGCARRSAGPVEPPVDVLVLDTMGELAGLYALADVVFVGGSLVPIGGHDILQPLFHGRPTLFGPHMHNQQDLAELVLREQAARQVSAPGALAEAVVSLCAASPQRDELRAAAERLLRENRGAAEEYARLLAGLAAREDLRVLRKRPEAICPSEPDRAS